MSGPAPADTIVAFGPDYYQRQVDDGGNCAELWDTLGAKGYLGVHLPEKYGGGGLGLHALAIVTQETAVAGCPLLALLFSAGVTGTILDRSAGDEQRMRWLPGVASDQTRLSFAITEPDAGSNAHRISATARRAGDRYVINGQIVFITGMESAQWLMVVTRTSHDEHSGRGRLSVLMVSTDTPGLSWTPIRTVMNQPGKSHQVFLRQCRGARRESDRLRESGLGSRIHRAEHRTNPDERDLHRGRAIRGTKGGRLRKRAPGVGPTDRCASGRRASVGSRAHSARGCPTGDGPRVPAVRRRSRGR